MCVYKRIHYHKRLSNGFAICNSSYYVRSANYVKIRAKLLPLLPLSNFSLLFNFLFYKKSKESILLRHFQSEERDRKYRTSFFLVNHVTTWKKERINTRFIFERRKLFFCKAPSGEIMINYRRDGERERGVRNKGFLCFFDHTLEPRKEGKVASNSRKRRGQQEW